MGELKTTILILILGAFFFSSCPTKKPDDFVIEQKTSAYQPATVIPPDTSGAYRSPTDLFRDNSQFDRASFFSKQIKYFGNRTVSYSITSRSLKNQRDTIFSVTNFSDRFFGSITTLFAQPTGTSVFREMNLRRSTWAQMVRMFAPSLFAGENINRDRIFMQFNNTNRGWIDYKTMVGEEIIDV